MYIFTYMYINKNILSLTVIKNTFQNNEDKKVNKKKWDL